jgi:hypothetical protein
VPICTSFAIAATGGPETWRLPVHAYFYREPADWRLVGLERMPFGNAPRVIERLADAATR